MQHERLEQLYLRWISGQETIAEAAELSRLLEDPSAEEYLLQMMEQPWAEVPDNTAFDQEKRQLLAQRIMKQYPPEKEIASVHFLRKTWFRYAAAVFLITGTATFFYLNNRPQQAITQVTPIEKTDILPGGNKAMLTLADGSVIALDSAANGALANEAGIQVSKQGAGMLVYHTPQDNNEQSLTAKKIAFNTMSTPKGGQYQIVLSDGTKVWLNAASSIHFPTFFGKERAIEVTGECYLEIAPDKLKPFYVRTGLTQVQVLGTSFNVNAYPNESSTRITLIEGSIKVITDDKPVLLKPGQQAVSTREGQTTIEQKATAAQILAWKNGLFNFENADLKTVMRELERWYDIDVKFTREPKAFAFQGKLHRNLRLSQILKVLKEMDIHYTLEGRVLTIQS